jgi:hypothetical protein
LIASDTVAVAVADALSVTLTVTLVDPAEAGVPETAPSGDKFSPAGRDPLATDHEYGGEPPDALSPCEYAVPTVPAGRDDVVTSNDGGLTVSARDAVAEPDALSVARTVKLLDPETAGVPDMEPLAERLNPAGSDPLATDHE